VWDKAHSLQDIVADKVRSDLVDGTSAVLGAADWAEFAVMARAVAVVIAVVAAVVATAARLFEAVVNLS
jgi:hypothetical protein